MTLSQFTFEGGSDGANLTNALSGSVASSIGTGAATFSAAHAAHGALGGRFYSGGGGNATFRRWPLAAPATQFQASVVLTNPGAQASTVEILGFVNSGGVRRLTVQVSSTGTIALRTTAATYNMATSAQVAAGVKFRLALEVTGGSTTASVIVAHLYLQSSPGVWDQAVGTAINVTDANMSTDQIIGVDVGPLTGIAAAYTVGADDLQLNDGAGSAIPDYSVANTPPIASAGGNQTVSSGATVNLTGTASDTDGSIVSTVWSYVSGSSTGSPTLTGGNTLTPSFTAGTAPQLYTLQLLVTDNLGGTASATVEVRVAVTGATDVRPLPFAAAKTGTWNRVGGSSSDGAALADESDSTYMESGSLSGTEQTLLTRLEPSGARATGKIQLKLGTDTGTGTAQVRLYEGGAGPLGARVLRQAWTQAVTSTATAYEFTLSAGTVSAISDWGNLLLEVGGTS